MSTVTPTASDLTPFDALKGEITSYVAPVLTMRVSDSQSNALALDTLKSIRALVKKVEDKRTELVKPMNDEVKRINKYAETISDPLAVAEAHIRGRMKVFADSEERRRLEELRKIEEERRRAAAEARAEQERAIAKAREQQSALAAFGADDAAAKRATIAAAAAAERRSNEAMAQIDARAATVSNSRPANTRKVKKWRMLNFAAVPDAYKILNDPLIGRTIAAGVQIPGIETYEENIVVAR